jgi:site-specific DNA-cytosine methylase
MVLTYGTVCSGVEAVSLAWEPLGMRPVFFSEIEEFPKAVLNHYWPSTPDLGDMTQIDGREWNSKLDIFWGSTPCQAFSLAGLREGTNDKRGALTLHFCRLANDIDPKVICWENVKGVLSDKKNAFGYLLAALAGEDDPLVPSGKKWTHAGYVSGPRRNIAWRLFDAKYSGVPQQRERVFLVACPSDGPDPRKILFEEAPGTEAFRPSYEGRKTLASALEKSIGSRAFSVAFRGRAGGERLEVGDEVANCLLASTGGSDKPFALIDDGVSPHVRQLTPIEAERLMGMPDNHTLIPFGRNLSSDAVRYKAIGNSLNVKDVQWIGERILREVG